MYNSVPNVGGTELIQVDEVGQEWLCYNGQRRAIMMRVPFIYQIPTVSALAAGATSTPVSVLIDSGSDFLWQAGTYEYDLAGAAYTYSTRPMPNWTVNINDSGSGRNLQNIAAPVGAWFGAVEKPIVRPLPYLFGAAATVQFTFTNFDAAVATGVIRCSLIGQQIYYKG